ncbi:hypothetical protein [Pseudoalteromonas lipolytica]|uniref:hypothetical protein n=1 Tax=Pseudoalteromonas lipolytica TaxID=570156 RepID=UPI000C692EA9|nr:hypothetical protein [Pseudoalteromonas lipolytica]MAE02336.1 hypothetical protein [Pseudoalteromonas sp.]|tara:strand:- start:855 stop:1490 length:636 start_codon:yes stop_codon:yes gene_type:complete
MTNNLTPILEFIELDAEQNPIVNEQGLPTLLQRPIAKNIPDLISKGKIDNLDMFAELHAQILQWDWAELYLNYLIDLIEVEEHNANLPEPYENGEGEVINVQPLPLPEAPERPPLMTPTEILQPYQKHINKLVGIEFKGVQVSLNESNQNGLSALKSALELAKEFEAENEFFPVNFNAETRQGVKVLSLVDEAEFKNFGLQFVMARKAFFE